VKTFVKFALLTLLLASFADAQMYDPFFKTRTMKKSHGTSSLLMPLPPLLDSAPMFTPTIVSAVMNEKAFINGNWYKVGDTVNGQQITSIQPKFVTFKEGNRLTMLGVGNQQKILRTKETQ
jgi:hypothetical protein